MTRSFHLPPSQEKSGMDHFPGASITHWGYSQVSVGFVTVTKPSPVPVSEVQEEITGSPTHRGHPARAWITYWEKFWSDVSVSPTRSGASVSRSVIDRVPVGEVATSLNSSSGDPSPKRKSVSLRIHCSREAPRMPIASTTSKGSVRNPM